MNALFIPPIGKPIQFSNMAPNSIIRGFQAYLQSEGIEARLIYWSDPEDADPAAKCSRVWLMRCEGMRDDEIEAIKFPTRKKMQLRFLWDPKAWNESFPPNQRIGPPKNGQAPKPSIKGWERMEVGEYQIFQIATRDMRRHMAMAICQRGLDFTFDCQRLLAFEEKKRNPTPVWKITRKT